MVALLQHKSQVGQITWIVEMHVGACSLPTVGRSGAASSGATSAGRQTWHRAVPYHTGHMHAQSSSGLPHISGRHHAHCPSELTRLAGRGSASAPPLQVPVSNHAGSCWRPNPCRAKAPSQRCAGQGLLAFGGWLPDLLMVQHCRFAVLLTAALPLIGRYTAGLTPWGPPLTPAAAGSAACPAGTAAAGHQPQLLEFSVCCSGCYCCSGRGSPPHLGAHSSAGSSPHCPIAWASLGSSSPGNVSAPNRGGCCGE